VELHLVEVAEFSELSNISIKQMAKDGINEVNLNFLMTLSFQPHD